MRTKIAIAIVALTAAAVLAPSTAHAAGQDGNVNNNEFVFYYNSNYAGSLSDFATAKADLASYDFLKPGLSGYGQGVKNNAASVTNLRPAAARVYYNSNYAGAYDQVAGESSRNLDVTYNDNASFRWQS